MDQMDAAKFEEFELYLATDAPPSEEIMQVADNLLSRVETSLEASHSQYMMNIAPVELAVASELSLASIDVTHLNTELPSPTNLTDIIGNFPDFSTYDEDSMRRRAEQLLPFCDRLQTFKPFLWSFKRKELSPLLCARYGWRCTNKHTIQCDSCSQFVFARLPGISDIDLFNKCVSRLRDKITGDGHSISCAWMSAPVAPYVYAPCVLTSRDVVCADLYARFATFTPSAQARSTLCDELNVATSSIEAPIYTELAHHLNAFNNRTSTDPLFAPIIDPSDTLTRLYLLFSLTGWSQHGLPLTIHCSECSRVVPLAYFVRRSRAFDPLTQHERWCAWVDEERPWWRETLRAIVGGGASKLPTEAYVAQLSHALAM